MNVGNNARPRYICDKCKNEIIFKYRKGFEVHKYSKWQNSCNVKDFDLCSSCERKLREWLNTREIPTMKEIIGAFPQYEEEIWKTK